MKLKNILYSFMIFIFLASLSSCSQNKQSSPKNEKESGNNEGYLIFINSEASNKNILYSIDLKEKKKDKVVDKNASSAASSDEKIAFISKDDDGKPSLYTVKFDGSSLQTVMNGTVINDDSLSWSHDGKKIAFTSQIPPDKGIEVYYVEDGKYKTPLRVTEDSFINENPAFSGDGREIYYTKNNGSNYDIYKFDVSSGTNRNISNNPSNDLSLALSFDGTRVFFLSDEAQRGKYDLYAMDMEGQNRIRYTTGLSIEKGSINISPDSSMIAFITVGDNGSKAVHVIDMKKSTIMVSEGGYLSTWSSDGKKLYFASSNEGKSKIIEFDIETKEMKDILNFDIKPGGESDTIKFLHFVDKLK